MQGIPRWSPAAALLAVALFAACEAAPPVPQSPRPAPDARPRTWMMGFSHMPPRLSTDKAVRGINLWSRRADLAIIHEDIPWKELLRGDPPAAVVEQKYGQLVDLYRRKGLKLVFVADITDGLAREKEAQPLRELKRSLAEPAVQEAHRAYVQAVVRRLKPEVLGLAAETNLVREIAPPAVYRALVQAVNAAAPAARAAGHRGALLVSVQVETAWGLMPKWPYRGIEPDLADFPFAYMLGLSSYPYFVFDDPARLPADYYARVAAGRRMRVMVTEGGWSSANVGPVRSSPELQAAYIRRQGELLDSVRAEGYAQLLFADFDLSGWPADLPKGIRPFITIGVVDSRFWPKPALAEWDALHARPLRP